MASLSAFQLLVVPNLKSSNEATIGPLAMYLNKVLYVKNRLLPHFGTSSDGYLGSRGRVFPACAHLTVHARLYYLMVSLFRPCSQRIDPSTSSSPFFIIILSEQASLYHIRSILSASYTPLSHLSHLQKTTGVAEHINRFTTPFRGFASNLWPTTRPRIYRVATG